MIPVKAHSFTIGADTVEVWFLPQVLDDDGHECDGLADYENRRIIIQTGMPPKREFSTLVHEAVHMAAFLFGFDLTETQVRCLETIVVHAVWPCGAQRGP